MSDAASLRLDQLPWDVRRGSQAIGWFILTEAMLFVAMFFSYFYLARNAATWPPDAPPKLPLALLMLVILLSSSATLEKAKWHLRRHAETAARWWVAGTILLGIVFLGVQVLEYRDHLRSLRPTSDAYGSIFYTITTIHGLHVVLGLLMLLFVLALPRLEPRTRLPYHPFHNASLYWHFVDAVWVLIVFCLYLLPRLRLG